MVRNVARELIDFARSHWLHGVLMVPAALLYTALHEALHALAVVAQGGRVVEFAWLPSAGEWGHVTCSFPPGSSPSDWTIALAPLLLPAALLSLGIAVALLGPPARAGLRRATLFWLFLLPAGDLVYTLLPYLLGSHNDLFAAFGPPMPSCWAASAAFGVALTALVHGAQRRLLGERAMSLATVLVLGCLAFALVLVATIGFFR